MRNGDLLSLEREYCETIHCLSRNIDVVKLPFSLRRTALFFSHHYLFLQWLTQFMPVTDVTEEEGWGMWAESTVDPTKQNPLHAVCSLTP